MLLGMLFLNFIYFNMVTVVGSLFWTELESSLVSYDRWLKITDVPQESKLSYDKSLINWPMNPSVEFKNFNLRYRPETEMVLSNISFKIEASQKIGVVGRTGAGKSTLCLALCRIVEAASGQIFIDGVDISKISLQNLREKIAIIPQDPTLFEGTLRFNLDPENKSSDPELIELLKLASLENLIDRNIEGLYQQIDAKGDNLSSGEKQLICICRAILRRNKIVLMDEATANIDIKTEETIQKLINERFRDATVITIAHRLNTIINSDKVLVLDKGKVAEFDTPKILMEDSSTIFYSFIQKMNKLKE